MTRGLAESACVAVGLWLASLLAGMLLPRMEPPLERSRVLLAVGQLALVYAALAFWCARQIPSADISEKGQSRKSIDAGAERMAFGDPTPSQAETSTRGAAAPSPEER